MVCMKCAVYALLITNFNREINKENDWLTPLLHIPQNHSKTSPAFNLSRGTNEDIVYKVKYTFERKNIKYAQQNY